MRLIKQIIIRKLSKLDEAIVRNQEPIAYHYALIGMCSRLLNTRIIDTESKNKLYRIYRREQLIGQEMPKTIITLNQLANKDHILIEKFLNTVKDVKENEQTYSDIYTPGCIG